VVEQDADDPPPHGRVESGAGLVPRLAVPQAVVEATQVRVEHAKFGVGRVLRSTGAGEGRKLDIDFEGGAHDPGCASWRDDPGAGSSLASEPSGVTRRRSRQLALARGR
jgi:hypothetical protein